MLRGALETDPGYESYNAKGWYPRPASDSPVRGMEFLAQKLAATVENIRLGHVIERIELSSRTVHVRNKDGPEVFAYGEACLATLPLPTMLRLCVETPKELLVACQQLTHNRVLSVALSVRGPRPKRCGHWRYYADESLCSIWTTTSALAARRDGARDPGGTFGRVWRHERHWAILRRNRVRMTGAKPAA